MQIKPCPRCRRSVAFMELLSSMAVSLVFLALFVGAGVALGLWQEGFGDSAPVLLERMLRRQGDNVARLALAAGDRSFAVAVRQCTRCRQAAQCRAWLTSGAREGYETFCPNARYVQHMKVLAS